MAPFDHRYWALTEYYNIDISDLDLVERLSNGRVDLTYGRRAYLLVFLKFVSNFLLARWISLGEHSSSSRTLWTESRRVN